MTGMTMTETMDLLASIRAAVEGWTSDPAAALGWIVRTGTDLAAAAAPALVGWGLRGAVVLAAAAAACLLLRRRSAALRHLAWGLGVAALLVMPLVEAAVPEWPIAPAFLGGPAAPARLAPQPAPPAVPPARSAVRAAPRAATPSVPPAPPAPPVAPLAPISSGGAVADVRVAPVAAPVVEAGGPSGAAVGGESASRRSTVADAHGAAAAPIVAVALSPLVLVLAGWLLGAGLLLGHLAVGAFHAGALARSGRPVRDPRALALADGAARRIGLRRPVDLLLSDRAAVPMTFGLVRPVIVLPTEATGWGAERLRHVLLHEMAHIERGDYAWGLAVEVARALHWFNPLAWLAADRMRHERELACDDRVLEAGCRPSDYASDLLGVAAGLRPGWRPAGLVVPMARPNELGSRLTAILDPAVRRERVGLASGAAAVGLAAVLALPVAALAPSDAGAEPAPEAPAVPADDPDDPAPVAAVAGAAGEPIAGAPSVRVATSSLAQELCVFQRSGKRSTNIHADDDRTRIRWTTDDCEVEIDVAGDVRFAADDSGVIGVPAGGRFEIEESFGRETRRVLAEPGSGAPSFRYWRNGDERPFDPEGRAWLAAVLPQLFRETTLNSEARARRILEQEGVDGLLAEIDRVVSDHVATRYFEHLMAMADLDEGQIRRVFGIAARRIDSDHYRSEILSSVVEAKGLTPPVRNAFLDALQDIDSDHYTHSLLTLLLDQPDLDGPTRDRILDTAVDQLDSNHYLSEILVELVRDGRLGEVGRATFLRTLRGLDSDHYRTEVVGAFMDQGPMRSPEVAEVVALTAEIDSDHYRSEVLRRAARDHELDGPALEAWIRALGDMDSDHYRRETLTSVLGHPRFGPEHLRLVLELATTIDSSHHRSELLGEIARNHRLEGDLRGAYLTAAESIDSEHYRDRALAALVRSGG